MNYSEYDYWVLHMLSERDQTSMEGTSVHAARCMESSLDGCPPVLIPLL
jgi:hypothetical protein